MKDRISGWTISGLILIVLSLVLIVISSALPYWQESRDEMETGVPKIGLWEVCFDRFTAPEQANDVLDKEYDGCVYVFDRELRHILHWIFPGWYIAVVTFVTLGLLVQPMGIILVIIFMLRVCSAHVEHILIGVVCLMNLINGLLTMVAILLFGLKASKDQSWMPNPASNFLSYSYGVCAFVPIFCFFAAMCFAVDYLRLNTQRLINARARIYSKGEFNNRF